MEFEQALEVTDAVVFAQVCRHLSDVEIAILRGTWQKQTYEQIAEASGYSISYLTRDIGPKLWKLLSQALGEAISKSNFRAALEQQWSRGEGEQGRGGEFPIQNPSCAGSAPKVRPKIPNRTDWGGVVDVSFFYGRTQELNTLKQWILQHHCRIVGLLGMGGIGKTSLSVKLAQDIQEEFEVLIWRSLRNAPSLETLLGDLIPFLSDQQDTQAELGRLVYWLRASRCLLILDNVETILQAGNHAGQYRPGYENYADLFRVVGETGHQSCLILTSREKPAEIAALEGIEPVHSLQLAGSPEAAEALIQAKGLLGTAIEKQQLGDRYGNNPLALKIVATSIQDLFDGEIGQFLEQNTIIFNSIRRLLEQQFERLSQLEQTIMYWLAINREWTTIATLAEDMVSPVPRARLLEALEWLSWRSLIEKRSGSYTQQPVVMEYVTDQLVEKIATELVTKKLSLFVNHALTKTTVKDYVRDTQIRFMLEPIADKLRAVLGSPQAVERQIQNVLEWLRSESVSASSSYASGNLINLCCSLQVDLTGYDFSHLSIWHAYLQRVNLHQVNFAYADLAKSVFTQTLDSVLSVAFSPDGRLLASGDAGGQVHVWQVADGKLLFTGKEHTTWVRSVAFSPDSQTLASGSYDQTVKLWDVSTGQCLQTLQGDSGWVASVVFVPQSGMNNRDELLLASGSVDQAVRFWKISRTGDKVTSLLLKTLQGDAGWVESVAFAPQSDANSSDCQLIATSGSYNPTIRLWNINTGECCRELQGHEHGVKSVAFSPDGQILASGSDDQTVRLWDVRTGECLRVLQGHIGLVWSVSFSPEDSQTLASSGEDGTVRLWQVSTGRCLKVLHGHASRVWSVAFSPDGDTLASGSYDQTVRLWDVSVQEALQESMPQGLRTGQPLKTLHGYGNGVRAIAFTPDGQMLASGSDDHIVRLWDAQTGECRRTLHGHTSPVWTLNFNSQGTILASSGEDRSVRIWDVRTGECCQILQGHTGWVWSLGFSPSGVAYSQAFPSNTADVLESGEILASGSEDTTIRLWNITTSQCLKTLQGHTSWVKSLAFSPNGQLLASGSYDQTVKLWDALTGECLRTLEGHTNRVWAIAFNTQGTLLASGGEDNLVKLWDVKTGQCLRTLQGHTNWIRSLAFSPQGTTLATTGDDRTVRLWEVSSGQCLKTLKGHTSWIESVVYSPGTDNMKDSGCAILATCGQDEAIALWDVQTGDRIKVLRAPRPYEKLNITGIKSLTEAQKATLKALGAVENLA